MSIPNYAPNSRRAEVSRQWHEAKAAKRRAREPDFETQRKRALDDARGTVLRDGVTYKSDGSVVHWQVRRSVGGRTDQFDIVADGSVWRTAGRRNLPHDFRPTLSPNSGGD